MTSRLAVTLLNNKPILSVTDQHFMPPPQPDPPDHTYFLALQQLRLQIQEIAPLDDQDWTLLTNKIRWEVQPKGALLLCPGQVCDHLRFLHRGAVIYYEGIDEEMQLEQVGWIALPTEMVIEINSFFQRLPTQQYLKCTVPCEFLTISFHDLQALYAESPAWNTAGRRLTEAYLLLITERTYFHLLNSAREKYQYFIDRFPEAQQLVSQKHIAAFLRIRPETLSRVRKSEVRSR